MIIVIVAIVSIFSTYCRESVKPVSDIVMANVEALTSIEYDSDCIEWVDKSCWDSSEFSLVHGINYYATCSGSSTVAGGKLECGAVSSYEPNRAWSSNQCLQCIRTSEGGKLE